MFNLGYYWMISRCIITTEELITDEKDNVEETEIDQLKEEVSLVITPI